MRLREIALLCMAMAAISVTTISAQPGGGGMGGRMGGSGGGMGGPRMMMNEGSMDPVAMTGYFELDAKQTIKKIKVKDDAEKREVERLIGDYTAASRVVYDKHAEEFVALEEVSELIASSQMVEMSDDDRTKMRSMMQGSVAIKSEMLAIHKSLKEGMENLLADNEKSLDRWQIYYQDICDSNNFSEREPRQREEGNERGGMRGPGGGMRGPGGGMGMGGF